MLVPSVLDIQRLISDCSSCHCKAFPPKIKGLQPFMDETIQYSSGRRNEAQVKCRRGSEKDHSELLLALKIVVKIVPFVVSHRGLLSAGNKTQWLQEKVLCPDLFSQHKHFYFWNLTPDLGPYRELAPSLCSAVQGNVGLPESQSTHLRPGTMNTVSAERQSYI